MAPAAIPATPEAYWEMWQAIYIAFLRRQLADPVLSALNWSAIQARAGGTNHPALEVLAGQMRQWLSALVAQGQALGAVRTDLGQDLLMDATFGMLEGGDRWFARQWDRMDDSNVAASARAIVGLLRDLTEIRGETS